MKKTLLYALAGALAIAGVAETAPPAAADPAAAGPRSLEELRLKLRSEGMTSLAAGDLQTVRHRRWHRSRYVPRRYTLRYMHRRGRWCGRYVGRRCYYTPRPLRVFRR
jgi:hypothetical protein